MESLVQTGPFWHRASHRLAHRCAADHIPTTGQVLMASASLPLPRSHSAASSEPLEKGLRPGAIGLLTSIVIGVASTAPAYSLAATLGFVVIAVGGGVQAPLIVLLAFIPILLVAYGYKELNAVDPDCGTTFTWATRAFGPITGWLGGWGIVGADILVMASLAEVAGQYGFLLFGAKGIGDNGSSGWVLLVGILWIVAMTAICYRGIELSARIQQALLSLEVVMLIVFAVTALVRVATGHAPDGHLTPAWSWFNPLDLHSFSTFVNATLLMVFIYWGWDSAVACNEETKDRARTPGRAAVISTLLLLGIYALVTVASQAFAGVGTTGLGLGNSANAGDVLNTLGRAVFGNAAIGSVLVKLLLLMVLTSASASTQTTILPTARATLSMSAYRALPKVFSRVHPRYFSPTVSTLSMGGVSIVFYVVANYISHGAVITDAVTACGMLIGFYYGLTGVSCFWYFRKNLRDSARSFFVRGLLPLAGGLMLLFAMAWSIAHDWNYNNVVAASFTSWSLPFPPHSQVGGVFLLGIGTMLIGVLWMLVLKIAGSPFFRGETLQHDTPTLVPDEPVLTSVDLTGGRNTGVRAPTV
jgi:amino acid transporter